MKLSAAFFPSVQVALDQHKEEYFSGPEPKAALKKFREELAALEKGIEIRNAKLDLPYEYLRPSLVENSVAIGVPQALGCFGPLPPKPHPSPSALSLALPKPHPLPNSHRPQSHLFIVCAHREQILLQMQDLGTLSLFLPPHPHPFFLDISDHP